MELANFLDGRDVGVEFLTAEETGASFPKTSIRVKPNQTPMTENADILSTIKDTQKNITDIYREMEYDDLQKALEGWLSQEGDDEVEVTDPAKNAQAGKPAAVEDVSAAFDDLFNS